MLLDSLEYLSLNNYFIHQLSPLTYSLISKLCSWSLIISSIFESQIKPAISSEIELAKSLKKPYLLTQISIEMKYEFHGSNSLLFKRGDIGENFYLIIKGKVANLIVEEISIYLSQ